MSDSVDGQQTSTSTTPRQASVTTFQKYKNYEATLNKRSARYESPGRDDLWLAQLKSDTGTVQWYRYTDMSSSMNDIDDQGVAADAYKRLKTIAGFRKHLSAAGNNISQQVLVISYNVENMITSRLKPHGWRQPLELISDIVGIGLDMDPKVWDHLRGRVEDFQDGGPKKPVVWQENSPVLDIGNCSLFELEKTGKRPSTILVFHPQLRNGWYENCTRFGRIYSSQSSFKPPSEIVPGQPKTVEQPTIKEHPDVWFLRQGIIQCLQPQQSDIDIVVEVFQTLIELHLSQPPVYLPFMNDQSSGANHLLLKYYEREGPTREKYFKSWYAARLDVDRHHIMLPQFKRFAKLKSSAVKREQLSDVVERFEMHVRRLEITEAFLRDWIASVGAEDSKLVTSQSIQSNKRSLLLTVFAFIFLPLSLATSIFGMNIQEINESGHSIQAFVVTGVVLCATTFGVWAVIAASSVYRYKMIEALRERPSGEWEYGFKGAWQFLILVGPKAVPRLVGALLKLPFTGLYQLLRMLLRLLSKLKKKTVLFIERIKVKRTSDLDRSEV